MTMPELYSKKALREMTTWLQDLIRINTAPPHQNETKAARYIQRVFKKEGISSKILERTKGRGNIIARIKGDGTARPLLLMSHLDVVDAETEQWEVPPFDGIKKDGYIWGRGALDCKNVAVLWMMAMVLVKRSGIKLKRDIIFCATADEESGHYSGMRWLVENHFDLIDAEAALNEGGGYGWEFGNRIFFPVQNAEKGNLWIKIKSHGEPGHGSQPDSNSSINKLITLLNKMRDFNHPVNITDTSRQMLKILAKNVDGATGFGLKLMQLPFLTSFIIENFVKEEAAKNNLRTIFKNTLSITGLKSALQDVNVIPSEASALADIRLLPGFTTEGALHILNKLNKEKLDIEILDRQEACQSDCQHPLMGSIEQALEKTYPGGVAMPFLLGGVTDATFLRPRGITVYGFTPLLPEDDIMLVHGHNERISIASLEFGLKTVLYTILDFTLN